MKNIAKAERPKSATAILPPRPLRESGKAAQTAFKPARTDGNSFIHMVNHFSGNLGIPKLAAATTFRTADAPVGSTEGHLFVPTVEPLEDGARRSGQGLPAGPPRSGLALT